MYERIGGQFLYLNGWSWFITDQPWNGLLCYRDDEITFEPSGPEACGYTLSIAPTARSPMPIRPNPGTDHFCLSLAPGAHTVVLCDAVGRMVLNARGLGPVVDVSTAHLPNGFYLIRVDGNTGPIRWLKQ